MVIGVTGVLAHDHVEVDSKDEQDIVTCTIAQDQFMKHEFVPMTSAKVCLKLHLICTANIILKFIFDMHRPRLVEAFHKKQLLRRRISVEFFQVFQQIKTMFQSFLQKQNKIFQQKFTQL